jgi:hypothetical protein
VPIPVLSYAAYIQGDCQMRNDDFAGQKFVKAIKGQAINGYAEIPIRGRRYRFDNNAPATARSLWSYWAADKIAELCPTGHCVLAPIPNTSAIVGTPASYGTFALARAAAERVGRLASVHDALRWTTAMPASHAGGTRRPEILYANLTYLPGGSNEPYILVDDVVTTSGHVQACRAMLESQGKSVIAAVCGAHTVYEQLNDVFNVPTFHAPDFDPRYPFGFRPVGN